MKVSFASRNTLTQIVQNGGSLPCKGIKVSGKALERRGLIKTKQDRFHITAKGRKWFDKN